MSQYLTQYKSSFLLIRELFYLCYIMTKQELKEWDRAQRRQLKEGIKSKAAARRVLKKPGILHLLVPKGTNKSSAAAPR
jgi:hypothetical protein